MGKDIPDLPANKKFRSKYGLPLLPDYGSAIETKDFWSKWPQLTYKGAMEQKTAIKVEELERLANETAFPYPELLREILRDVTEGASIGVAQGSDMPSDSTNASSAFESGAQISDAICKMIEEDFVMGPFKEEDLPFSANRFSGIMAKMKPNNTARMILNLSRGFPHSVNSGIDKADFPTLMSSTESWIRVLFRCGRGAEMTKTDWAAAYKQLRVRPNEVWQQAFRWLGRVFYELCLVFGAVSSAGLFDRLAKLVLHIVLVRSKMPARCVIQHLDDVCSASPAGSGRAQMFSDTYQEVCGTIGVKLAPTDDPDKAFGPRTEGLVLGVCYNTVEWVWFLREDKLARILNKIQDAIEDEEMTQRSVMSLTGKLTDIRCLVPNSKFHLGNLILDSHQVHTDLEAMVELSNWTR